MCVEWHCFTNFLDWFKLNYIENCDLDKDLLQFNIENKIYSPNTCVFLDNKMNNFIVIRKNNKHGVTGISCHSNIWRAECTEFYSGEKKMLGVFKSKEDARSGYIKFKLEQIESAKHYMRDSGFYTEDIINNLDYMRELI